MQDPFVVAFVVGVTPSKWARIWGERMPRPLELRPLPRDAALAALADGSAHVALVRLADGGPPGADAPGSGGAGSGSAGAGPAGAGTAGSGLPDELSAIPLYTESAVVVSPKDHAVTAFEALTIADLAGEMVLGAGAHDSEPDWAGLITLVAANVGVAVVPQPVARALSRRDVVATPIAGTPETRIALVWVTARQIPETEEFIGIVRGRTANSSRGAGDSGAGEASSGGGGSGGGGSGGAGSGAAGGQQAKKAKSSGGRSATPSRRDPRASRARRR